MAAVSHSGSLELPKDLDDKLDVDDLVRVACAPSIPGDQCGICYDLLPQGVRIKLCGHSFCSDCLRFRELELQLEMCLGLA